jgi:transcriptional regulator with XRE-family HTH domain
VTFQQIQKYEHGANRVSASRLSAMANILGVPIAFVFENLSTSGVNALCERLEQPETIALVRLYYAVPDESVRQHFLETAKAIAA